jgi:hypothetical protein
MLKPTGNQSLELENTNDVLSNLKFIGKIQEGEKINVKYKFVQPVGLATSLSRTFYYQDNKGNAFNFINHTVSRSIEIFKLYFHTGSASDITMCRNILSDLKKAMMGIRNLKITYLHDTMFCCKLDTLTTELSTKITELNDGLPPIPAEDLKINN